MSTSTECMPLNSEFLMQLEMHLDAPQAIGDTPLGGRRIIYSIGGSFEGPRVKGEVLPGGGDWVLVRNDGVGQLDVRITLQTDDGALIFVNYRGILDMSPEIRQRVLAGESVDPSLYYFRAAPVFETSAEKYAWLNRIVAIGVGRRTAGGVIYSIYAIR